MSADELRKAAETLRGRAGAATPPPWRDSSTTDGVRFGALVAPEPHPQRPNAAAGGWGWEDAYGGCLVGESLMSADRSYIATMHPGVGVALADLLDHEAKLADFHGPRYFLSEFRGGIDALALARLINGGAA